MYINLLYLPLFNFAYLFFLSFLLNIFFSFIFIALFSNWHPAFCFPVCALVRIVPADIIFGFLCLLCQSIVLYFCWTVLYLLKVFLYMCIFSHTFYCCYKPLPLHWAFASLWSFLFFFSFSTFSFLFFII